MQSTQQRKQKKQKKRKQMNQAIMAKTFQYDVLLLKTMLVLHIALVLQHLRSGSQNKGGGGNQCE